MLDLGVCLALRGGLRTVCHVEREASAAALLVARMEDSSLDPAPIWDDLFTFDGLEWRNKVDLVLAGLPCQPYSLAGERRGNEDERALWPELVRIVRECEPSAVFLENVPEFLKYAEPVWGELRGLGFEWSAPYHATTAHFGGIDNRHRVFLFASHPRLRARDPSRWACVGSSNGVSVGLESERCGWILDEERQTFRHNAHGRDLRCRICGSPWASESPPARVDARPADWVDRIRITGNGVSPLVAAHALRALSASLSP